MTKPHPMDLSAVGGHAPGTQSISELENNNGILGVLDTNRSLAEEGQRYGNLVDNQVNSLQDNNKATKYPTDPSTSYYGNGTLSLTEDGNLSFNDNSNEYAKSSFSINKVFSKFYSDSSSTTIGSLDVKTTDGHELNYISSIFPSTHYSPTKPWVKILFPWLTTEFLVGAVIQGALVGLIYTLEKNLAKASEDQTRKEKSDTDMALIIQNNQEIENEIIGDYLSR
jgi:hypothetical protein